MKINILIVLMIMTLPLLAIACTRGVTETTGVLTPPSPEELEANDFVLPEIPRILCEQLKQMMDSGSDFVLVDTRPYDTYLLEHLPGAINISEDPSPPHTQEWINEQLMALPIDKMVVFYCDWPDDNESASLAEELIQFRLGNTTNIVVLWKGYYRWLELGYPTTK